MLAADACYAVGRDCLFLPRHALASLLNARPGGFTPPSLDEEQRGWRAKLRRRRSGVRSSDCTHAIGGAGSNVWRHGALPVVLARGGAALCVETLRAGLLHCRAACSHVARAPCAACA